MVVRDKKQLGQSENGFASLVIALTLIIILTLITVGFAQLIRREQTNALNKQLSTQAFYAAESGVNDAVKAIKDNQIPAGGKTTCDNSAYPDLAASTLDAANSVSYTCVLINVNPNSLFHAGIGDAAKEDSNSNAWTIVGDTNGVNVGSFTVNWVGSRGHTVAGLPNSVGSFKPDTAAGWGTKPAVLRFSVTPLGGGESRSSLMLDTYTAYLYPVIGSPDNPAYARNSNSLSQGQIFGAKCKPAGSRQASCTIDISMAGATAGPYLFHIVSIYDSSDITITADGGATTFKDTQAIIDSTGKAQDVLRRIQVRYPLQASVPVPPALDAQNICKRFVTNPNTTNFYSTSPLGSFASGSNPCNLEN